MGRFYYNHFRKEWQEVIYQRSTKPSLAKKHLLKHHIFTILKNMLTDYTQDDSMKLQVSYLKYLLPVCIFVIWGALKHSNPCSWRVNLSSRTILSSAMCLLSLTSLKVRHIGWPQCEVYPEECILKKGLDINVWKAHTPWTASY